MVPCPWARDAAARYRGEDVGVHLTLNAEHDRYRWGPITHAPSLLDGDGGFPRTVDDVWDHADLDEVRRELRAQVERAILWGFDVSHLDTHMGTLQLRPEFFDVYLDLAVEFGLPLRLSGASSERSIGFPFRRLAAEEGVLFPDHFVQVARASGRGRTHRAGSSTDLRPGVTEVLRPPRGRHPRAAGPRRRLADPRRRPRPTPSATAAAPTLERAGVDADRLPAAARPAARRLRCVGRWSALAGRPRAPRGVRELVARAPPPAPTSTPSTSPRPHDHRRR